MRHLATLLGPLLLTAGCVPMPLFEPAQVATTERDVAPIERLGRWDGSGFVPVEPGSVEPTRVHVIVHGWAPGWYRDGGPPAAPAWAAEQDGQPFEPWMHELASALGERDPHAAVFVYTWLDDAATGRNPLAQRRAYARTSEHGRRLSVAIETALSHGFRRRGGAIHLIGHSFGARVATIAGAHLDAPPRHLTLLDAPDAGFVGMFSTSADIAPLLRRLPVGSGEGQTFVDNYVSGYGTGYRYEPGLAAVVDVQTTPPNGAFDLTSRHVWAAEFYARTADQRFGIGWSPLHSTDRPPHGCFSRPYDEIALVPRCG